MRPGGEEVNRNGKEKWKSPIPESGLLFSLGYLRRLPLSILPAAIFHWRLAALAVHRSGLEAALFQRMTWCLEKRTFDSIRIYGISPRWIFNRRDRI